MMAIRAWLGLSLLLASGWAFSFQQMPRSFVPTHRPSTVAQWPMRPPCVVLRAGADGEEQAEAATEPEASVEESVEAVEAEAEAEEEAEPEDPETAALKKEIEELEGQLGAARINLSNAKDKVDESGQAGYSRLAAMVDNFRRTMKGSRSDQEGYAQMRVLTNFVDLINKFETAETDVPASGPEEESVHVGYQKLYAQLMEKFTQAGMERFDAAVGDEFDAESHEKMSVVEATDDLPPGTVAEQVRDGLRTTSGVLRKAQVVVAEGEDAPADDEDAADEEDD